MPRSAPRRCRTCKQLIHGRCPTCDAGWVRKPTSWAGGSTRAWRQFRRDWLDAHPVCMDYATRDGCTYLATVVCHKPGTDYTTDRLNPDAIEGQRCSHCDAIVTAQQGSDARSRRRG